MRNASRVLRAERLSRIVRPMGPEDQLTLAILSCSPRAYSTQRLRLAAEQHGFGVKVLNTLRFSMDLSSGDPTLHHRSKVLPHYDAIVPRIGASITYFGTAVVRQFEQMGIYSANSSLGVTNSRDKLRSLQILSRLNIGIPKTTFVRDRSDVMPAIERVGGAPVIIKLLEGTQGVGVILADSSNIAAAIIETLHSTKQNVLIQKFVAESKGKDVRAIVIGDQVVAAMRRVAQGQEFRSNVHRGGKTEVVDLDDTYRETAVRAAQIMGLRFAGVDMLEGKDGPQVMEVNSSPGLEGIESTTGLDIAGSLMQHIKAQLRFPEIDIRQRLTVSRGYDVADLLIPEGADMVGKSIADSGLKAADINVLSLHRDGKVIPNPKPERLIEAGDRLLCFGKVSTMRDLIPEKSRRRRNPAPSQLRQDQLPDHMPREDKVREDKI